MDNLPKDPSNENNPTPASPAGGPPSFGSNFDPHSNPVDPNNPYFSQPPVSDSPNFPTPPDLPDHPHSIHSEVAEHRPRDAHGHFLPYEHPTNPNSQNTPTPVQQGQAPLISPNAPENPESIQVIHGDNSQDKSKDDDPLFEAKVNNPFSKFFNWIKRLIKHQDVTLKIPPLTAIAIAVALTGGGGIIGGIIGYAFPHSSPILHRAVIYQGNLQKTPTGFILTLPNSDLYTLKPKANSSINFQSLGNGPALVKGNLTPENFVIEATEIIPLGNPYIPPAPTPQNPQPATSSGQQYP